jgi:hypothetical protein
MITENLRRFGLQHPGYRDKECSLVDEISQRVCRDHSVTRQQGQGIFLSDWIARYQQIFGEKP